MNYTDVPDARAALDRFLTEAFPNTVLLFGPWGAGKTYVWQRSLEAVLTDKRQTKQRYAYVSLFGIASPEDLRLRLFESLQTVREAAIGWQAALDKVANRIPGLRKRWRKAHRSLELLPVTRELAALVRSGAYSLVTDAVICIDDLERRADSLSVRDVLGVISNLREEKSCKVILIANDSALETPDRDVLERLREKVFEISLSFNPPPSFATDCVFREPTPLVDAWRTAVERLKVTNIRVIQRVVGFYGQLSSFLRDSDDDTKRQVIYSLLILGVSKFEPAARFPIEFLRHHIKYSVNPKKSPYGEEQTRAWLSDLSLYGWSSWDELDEELAFFVETGTIRRERLESVFRLRRLQSAQANAHAQLSNAWGTYHDTYENNEAEVIAAIRQAHEQHVAVVSPGNLDSAVRLLRDLDRGDLADELITHYIEHHADDPAALDLENYAFAEDITDTQLRQRFEAAFKGIPVNRDLRAVLNRIHSQSGWGRDDVEFLATRAANEYRDLFMALPANERQRCVRVALEFANMGPADSHERRIAATAHQALVQIAGMSRLNARRLRIFGIEPPH